MSCGIAPGLSDLALFSGSRRRSLTIPTWLAELEDKLARADVIDVSKLSGDTIRFGAGGRSRQDFPGSCLPIICGRITGPLADFVRVMAP